MSARRRLLGIEVEHDDVGLTLNTTIRLGGEILAEYHAQTRYPDTADSIAEDLLARALRPLLERVIEDAGLPPAITYDMAHEEEGQTAGYRPRATRP